MSLVSSLIALKPCALDEPPKQAVASCQELIAAVYGLAKAEDFDLVAERLHQAVHGLVELRVSGERKRFARNPIVH
jgi:hypothetical protein